jgi:phosphopantothenoylcysteine decarboxylase/phosphopantothenate--cysteine ligase
MKVLFIITASIAIKKCNKILKELSSNGIIINCILTENALEMANIKELKKNISGKIYTNKSEKNNKMLHIKLTRKSDLIVLCPATANIIAKFANGFANDLASTTLIASDKQILVIPAMNSEMWNNPINQKNVSFLIRTGIEFIGPEYGRLSCGEVGLGRLSNVKKINKTLLEYLNNTQIFKNKKCLITAGPTIEPIDDIRFLSNHSSGKQGYEIAKQMILSGANVTLISGPTNLQAPFKSKLIKINTAKEMYTEVKKNLKTDIVIFTAAVTDATPKKFSKTKIKKENFKNINLKKNKDILYEVSSSKKNRPKVVIGFAAETTNHIKNAKIKLIKKNCDAIIVNKIDKKNKVFNSEMNKISIVTKEQIFNFKKTTKVEVAKKITNFIHKLSL